MANKVIFFLLLFSNVVSADIGSSVFYSKDSDGNQVKKISASVWWNQFTDNRKDIADSDIGVSYTKLKYSNDLFELEGDSLGLLFDYRKDKLWVIGNANVVNLDDEKYISSDMSFLYFFTPYTILNGGFYSDIVDSPNGLLTSTMVYGYYTGIETSNKYIGASVLARQSFFTNDNRRDSYQIKLYTPPYKGFFLYGSYLENQDMNSYNDVYFSPDSFIRKDIGVAYRNRIFGHLVFANFDYGETNVDGFTSSVNSWKFGVETNRNEWYRINILMGQDLNSLNYQYTYLTLNAKIEL